MTFVKWGVVLISDYVIIDAKGMEIAEFEKSATIPGAYNIVKSALNSGRLVVIVGLYSDGKPVMPIISRPVDGDTLELRGITMKVGENDKMTPIDSGSYELPVASYETLGGIKVGENLYIDEDGLLSVPYGDEESAGVFKVGEGLEVDENGVLNAQGGSGKTFYIIEPVDLPEGGGARGVYYEDGGYGFLNFFCSIWENPLTVERDSLFTIARIVDFPRVLKKHVNWVAMTCTWVSSTSSTTRNCWAALLEDGRIAIRYIAASQIPKYTYITFSLCFKISDYIEEA